MSSGTTATSSTQTTTSETTSTTVVPVQWVTVGEVKSIDYYLSLLESNGTAPYVQLASELRKLPDLSNETAVAQITYLALNASNPDVKEVYELMLKGGTANAADFGYPIPQYNTELQILYWLAAQRQLKRDDTLALAIALSNGIWVTIGDNSVRTTVMKNVVDLLDYFRETDSLQRIFGYPRLEQLPLEAKIALAWLGGNTGTHGPHGITGSQTKHNALQQHMNLFGYEWDTVNATTLRQMRDYVSKQGWISSSIDLTVTTIEDYFYFSGASEHFNYVTSLDATIQVFGETVPSRLINNANFEYQYYLQHGHAIGVCEDETVLVSALLKSWGIPTLTASYYWPLKNLYGGHSNTMYYDAASTTWKVNPYQLGIPFYLVRDAYIFLPPVLQNEFVPDGSIPREAAVPSVFQSGEVNTKMFAPMYNITGSYLNRFKSGVATAQMKQWILYRIRPPTDTTTLVKWSYQGPWAVIPDGSQDLVDQNGKVVGDLGQPYVDLSNVSYSFLNGSLFFRFSLHGKIPKWGVTANVTSIWYQVLLDSDSDSGTGYDYRSRNFTPDYMLEFYVSYDPSTNTVNASSDLVKHCGGSSDWCWAAVGFTQHFASAPLIMGGVGADSFVLTCDYQDVSASSGSTIQFFARSGIMYNSQVYNDPAPDDGTIRMTLH
jgi:hypothetical protein